MGTVCKCEYCKKDFTVKFKCRVRRFCTKKCARSGENNPAWVGDKVGIVQVHTWVARELGRPGECSKCGKAGNVDLANISQQYKRDLDDWEWLCRKCHMESDGRLDIFKSHSNMNNKAPDQNCLLCGKLFTPKSYKRQFCSMSCSATHTNLNKRDYSGRAMRKIKEQNT